MNKLENIPLSRLYYDFNKTDDPKKKILIKKLIEKKKELDIDNAIFNILELDTNHLGRTENEDHSNGGRENENSQNNSLKHNSESLDDLSNKRLMDRLSSDITIKLGTKNRQIIRPYSDDN
jgi:hypothetical protein